MNYIKQINESLEQGNSSEIRKNVKEALNNDISSIEILEAMLENMAVLGAKFRNNEIFVPEV